MKAPGCNSNKENDFKFHYCFTSSIHAILLASASKRVIEAVAGLDREKAELFVLLAWFSCKKAL